LEIPPLTSDILAISLDGKGSPSINLNLPPDASGSHSHGWGFGWYPDDHLSAMLTKDPGARGEQVIVDAITDWSSFRSTTFFFKVHGASEGYNHTQTQPFSRSFAGRDWLFLHNGDLNKAELENLHGRQTRLLEPLGNTDSELAFCNLLAQLQLGDARRIADVIAENLHDWFKRFDNLGSSDMFLSDGESIVCFHGTHSPKQMYYKRVQPPENQNLFVSEAAEISLNDPRDTYRTALIISSSPFSQGEWSQMQPGQMLIIRRGAIIWQSQYDAQQSAPPPQPPQPQQQAEFMTESQGEQAQSQVTNMVANQPAPQNQALEYRLYDVIHNTYYEYAKPVEHSTHTFRLQPTNDATQEVVSTQLVISSPNEEIKYEDVFGNQAIHYIINQPYTKLSVEATSRVKIYAAPPDNHSLSRRQTSIPLTWMPWQRQMMMPYLLPPELPESQLTELTEYAMSFVERNDYQLLNTIVDLNNSIYRDYKYVSGSTSLITTAFQVYTSRQGVCQDFANLFICLARLLSIPSRYRMGYIYTGANYANKIQSDASHAWVEVYLPYVGWRGFDPTNGCAVNQDHIRVACGRNYRDATPTSGTIYKGGGTETLTVDVKIHQIFDS
jgi:transglutaminase-like putative cysteine protease/predicted glutamine amidotransferase